MSVLGGPNRTIEDGLVLYLDPANTKSTKFRERLYNYTIWEDGQTGGVSPFSNYSTRNRRIIAKDPWENDVVVWESYNVSGSTNGGGIYMNASSIDNTKMYRMSWWEKRIQHGDATYARYYAGLNGYGTTAGVIRRSDGFGPSTNPYFFNTSNIPTTAQLPLNEWVLVAYHVWPVDSGTGANHADSGRYTVLDGKFSAENQSGADGGVDWIWHPDTTTARSRTLAIYLPNATEDDGVLHHSCYPRLDIIDGTEPSIYDLLNNRTDTVYDISRSGNHGANINGATFDPSGAGSLLYDGKNDYLQLDSEIQFTDGQPWTLSAWIYKDSSYKTYEFWIGPDATVRNFVFMPTNTFRFREFGDTYHSFGSHADFNEKWTLHTYVCDGTDITAYINGSEYSTVTPTDTSFRIKKIGNGYTGVSLPFFGKLSIVQIYNRDISSAEILQNFNSQRKRFNI